MAGALEVQEVRERLRYDTPFFAKHCLTVLNEDRVPVKLVARPWQARTPDTPVHMTPLDEALEAQRAAGQPQRVIILKARKLGMSTWMQAKLMQRATQFPYESLMTVAHRQDASGKLADMARFMYDRLPTMAELGLGFNIKPQLVGQGHARNGARFMVLGDKMRPTEASVYETLTAGAKGGGRSATPSAIHCSEVAHWEDEEFLTGLMNALPLRSGTMAALETTANGFNFFHDLWTLAVDGAADPETGVMWMPLFYGWQDNPFNALPFINENARARFERTVGDPDGGGDEEEAWLLESFPYVTLEQLHWRRTVRDGPECRGSVERFHQEHPATAEQAFIGSGQPVFPGILVAKAISAAERSQKPVEGVLRGVDARTRVTRQGTVQVPQRALWVPGDDLQARDHDLWGMQHRLLVWEHPLNERTQEGLEPAKRRPDGQYVAFADVSMGQGNTDGAGDWHAIQVVDHMTRLQVARYRSRVPLHDLPLIALLIALYYNEAWLAVEVNGPGIAVVDALRQDYRYRKLYRRRTRGDTMTDGPQGQLVGWQTTTATKPLMEQTFGQELKDGSHGLRDVLTGREFTTYVEDPKNPAKHGAQKGAHDDLAIAFMGAKRVAAEYRPRDPGKKPSRSVRGRRLQDDVTGW